MTLTLRQQQILTLIATELTTAQIADALGLSVPTVETHRRNLFRKAGVWSVTGLVKEAMRQALVYIKPLLWPLFAQFQQEWLVLQLKL